MMTSFYFYEAIYLLVYFWDIFIFIFKECLCTLFIAKLWISCLVSLFFIAKKNCLVGGTGFRSEISVNFTIHLFRSILWNNIILFPVSNSRDFEFVEILSS